MTLIVGASQFLNAATLANQQGTAPSIPTILDAAGSDTVSILDVGRSLTAGNGLGISARARELNNQFLNNAQAINELLSLTAGADATLEGAQQQILALRARIPESQLAPSLQTQQDDGSVSESGTGQTVDTEA